MPAITMSKLGRFGRWGNSLLQYAFVRCYALRNGIDYQVPEWQGRNIFGLQDPPVSVNFIRTRERYLNGARSQPCMPDLGEFTNCDFIGYGQQHTSWFRPHEQMIRQWFTPRPEHIDRVQPAIDRLRSYGKTVIALQVRRSDFGYATHYRTPASWYKDWLKRHLSRFESPVILVDSDDRELYREFSEFNPHTIESLGISLHNNPPKNYDIHHPSWVMPSVCDFFPSWWILSHADVLLISNSTYGFTAAMLSRCLKESWRSNLPARTFVPFSPWWSDVGEHNHLDDWPGIPGTQVDNNRFAPYASNKHKEVPE